MKKFKQCTYTVLLMATCFIASPFIFHQIWKNSSDSAKKAEVPPPSVTSPADVTDAAAIPNGTVDPNVPPPSEVPSNGIIDPTASQLPTTGAAPAVSFISSDLSYFDDALFIGDSRTVGIQEYGTIKNADYFCSVGMSAAKINDETIDGMTFDEAIAAKQYGKVYLMLGINEVGNDFEYTLTAYRAVVEKIKVHQPNAIIYLQGNLHVASSAETNVINNEGINYLNSRIASLADNSRVFYIDINEVYDDESGCLTESYTSDGVHPLAMYYQQWCEWLCSKSVVLG